MSYQEKRSLTGVLTGVIVLAAYCVYCFNPHRWSLIPVDDLKYWARVMLIFIGIGVGASIVLQILFNIFHSVFFAVKEAVDNKGQVDDKNIERSIKIEMTEDERDRQIELKSVWGGFVPAGIGFLAALICLLFGASVVVMLNVIFISFLVGPISQGIIKMVYYHRGI